MIILGPAEIIRAGEKIITTQKGEVSTYLTFRSLLSSCSSFRDSQYGSGGVHVNSSHDFDSSTHANQINAEDASFLNGELSYFCYIPCRRADTSWEASV